MKSIIIVALVCALAFSQTTNEFQRKITNDVTITQQEWFFTQYIDHLHPQSTKSNDDIKLNQWKQRFCTFSQYWDPLNGAVFISIGGESTMKGISPGRGWLVKLAEQYKALVISIEHRFYGVSQPFPQSDTVDSLSTDNLRYLTHDQALADIAYFIGQVKQNNFADGSFKVSPMNPFITVGGSYPGAMSAWFRYKYPHLTVGSLASSAVVNAIKDFWRYDDQIFLSTQLSGDWCPKNIQDFIQNIQQEVQTDTKKDALLKSFNCQNLSVKEFLFYIPDQIASYIQYGQRTDLCELFKTTDYETQKKNLIADFAKNPKGHDSSAYAQGTLNNPKLDITDQDNINNMRQWLYQYCSYFGWLQTPSQVQGHQMRGSTNSLAFFLNQCVQAFQSNIYQPKAGEVNGFYGGLDLQGSNIIFTNGSEDPWKWASLTQSKNGNIAIVSDCQNCAHGVELGYPSDSDSKELQNTRTTITNNFTKWINDFRNQFKFTYVQTKIKNTSQ